MTMCACAVLLLEGCIEIRGIIKKGGFGWGKAVVDSVDVNSL